MALFSSVSASPVSLTVRLQTHRRPCRRRCLFHPVASSTPSTSPDSSPSTTTSPIGTVLSSARAPDKNFKYAPATPNSSSLVRFVQAAESNIEKVSQTARPFARLFALSLINYCSFDVQSLFIAQLQRIRKSFGDLGLVVFECLRTCFTY